MTTRIQVVSDLICPWCFIGTRRLEAALKAAGADRFEVEWLPFELDPGMPAGGAERTSYRAKRFGSIATSRQMDLRATQVGQTVGIGFRYDRMSRTPNTLNAHRLVWWAREGNQGAVVDALFRAYFLEGRDIGALPTLLEIAEETGLPRPEVAAFLSSEAGIAEVRELEQWALRKGVAAVPSWFVNRDRLVPAFESLSSIIQGAHT